MARRERIGLTFSYNEDWIAGTYYILNIIHALKCLPEPQRPVIVIISDSYENFLKVVSETKYRYLEYFEFPVPSPKYSLLERALNRFGRIMGIRKIINKKRPVINVDFIYPFEIEKLSIGRLPKINWIPDFQEFHLPELFTKEIIEKRKKHHENTICNGDMVVFSSIDSRNDFDNIYPRSKPLRYVLPFAVTHPDYEELNFEQLCEQYKLPGKYYFVPNQFWAHKNHQIVLQALLKLKEEGLEIHVAFSGKEDDHRNSNHFNSLKEFVNLNDLNSTVHFLGFMPRSEQLKLMSKSIAIVQPSLFEGWSTVVEDAKAMNKFLVLSDIGVHREQINYNVEFFNPDDAEELADKLRRFWTEEPQVRKVKYDLNRIKFAQDFMKIAQVVKNKKEL